MPFFIEGADKKPPSDDDAQIYEIRKHEPVIAPDGHHVTLAEFSTVRGSAAVRCENAGTRTTLNLRGLIPNGVYTIWNVTFNEPGMDPAAEMLNIRGLGVLGRIDGSENYFTASAQISAVTPGGPLSMLGDVADCPLTDEREWHLVGAYHMDGQTYGPDLGPDGTAVEQFGFIFTTP